MSPLSPLLKGHCHRHEVGDEGIRPLPLGAQSPEGAAEMCVCGEGRCMLVVRGPSQASYTANGAGANQIKGKQSRKATSMSLHGGLICVVAQSELQVTV